MATQNFKIGAFDVRFVVGSDRVQFFCSTGGAPEGRFLQMKDGGGHLELSAPGNITTGTGLELDETGHAVFRLE